MSDPTAGERGIEFPAHHIVGADLGFTCTNCGGHTSTTPPCIPARMYALTPAAPDVGDASEPLLLRAARRMAETHPHRHIRIVSGSGTTVGGFVAEVDEWLAAREAAAATRGLAICDQPHGHEGNPAKVYGHHGSPRTCICVKATNEWLYDPGWEATDA